MWRAIVLAVFAVSLGGCFEDKGAAFAGCEFSVQYVKQIYSSDREQLFFLCMRSKGFEPDKRSEYCAASHNLDEKCYRPVGSVAAIINDVFQGRYQ